MCIKYKRNFQKWTRSCNTFCPPLTSCNLVNMPTTLKTVLWMPQIIDISLNVAFFSIVLILKAQSTDTSESPKTC